MQSLALRAFEAKKQRTPLGSFGNLYRHACSGSGHSSLPPDHLSKLILGSALTDDPFAGPLTAANGFVSFTNRALAGHAAFALLHRSLLDKRVSSSGARSVGRTRHLPESEREPINILGGSCMQLGWWDMCLVSPAVLRPRPGPLLPLYMTRYLVPR